MTTVAPVDDAVAMLAPVLGAGIAAVRAAAERVLASASGGPKDQEAVHDFRVALRRLRTALRPARRVYGQRRLALAEAELRAHAQASGALRDEEVLHETLGALELKPRWRAAIDRWLVARRPLDRRRRADLASLLRGTATLAVRQPPRAVRAPLLPPIAHTLAALEASLRPKRRPRAASVVAQRSLESARERVLRLSDDLDARDGSALHALRIAFKRLRYTAELFAPFYGPAGEAVAVAATRMQKRLGDVHDLDGAVARVARARSLDPRARAAVIEALRALRTRKVARSLEELAAFSSLPP